MTSGPYASRQRETLLRLPLPDLAAWHLVVICPACRVERFVRVADLLTRYGAHASLAGLVPRLRCAAPACR